MLGGFGIAVCLGWAGVRLNFQGEAEGSSGCTCCSLRLLCGGVSTCSRGCCVAVCVGSGDNRETIHARSDCCLQPLSLSARLLCALRSIISFSVIYIFCLSLCRLCQIAIIHTLSFVFSNLSVCLSLLLLLFFCLPSPLFFNRNTYRNTNINSSSWELL